MRSLLVLALIAFWAGSGIAGDHVRNDPVRPDWGYAYQNPHYVPDAATPALIRFHHVFIPMYEARHSNELAYIRENAGNLFEAATAVPGSVPAAITDVERKHYRRGAKDLVRSCKRLKEVVHSGANGEVSDQMRRIERDYLRLANLSE